MGSIKNVISESIEGHEEYHIMVSLQSALQGVKQQWTWHPTSFPGFSPTLTLFRSVGRVGENPGNEVGFQVHFS